MLREIKEKVDFLDWQQKSENLEKECINELKTLVERIGEILSQNPRSRRSSTSHEEYSKRSSGTSIRSDELDNDDLHLWLPGKEFRSLIRSQGQRSLAYAELRASQEELRLAHGELTGIVKEKLKQLQTRTSAIEDKLDVVLKRVSVDSNEDEISEQSHL